MAVKLPDELAFMQISRLPQKHTQESMAGKTCVISGATSGVGLEGARALAKAGARIIIFARNEEKAKRVCKELTDLSGVDATYYLADFSDLTQVKCAAKKCLENVDTIHVLINSAGLHSTRRRLTSQGNELVFTVNHLAAHLLTRMLIPKMTASAPARIIHVNSEGHRFGGLNLKDLNWQKRLYYGLGGYGASKTAQLLCMLKFTDQLKDKGVTINAMHPGAVKTGIGQNNGIFYRTYMNCFLKFFLKDAAISGDALYYLAAAPELEGVSGKFFNLTNEETPAPHARRTDRIDAVFEVSESLTTV